MGWVYLAFIGFEAPGVSAACRGHPLGAVWIRRATSWVSQAIRSAVIADGGLCEAQPDHEEMVGSLIVDASRPPAGYV